MSITQAEANALLAMPKYRATDSEYEFPTGGGKLSIPLISGDDSETFLLDVNRARFKITQATLQNRARTVIILARLDIDGPPHRNPDGEEFPCPHLHVYREGHGDRWAQRLPLGVFTNVANIRQTFDEFMAWCKVVEPPLFRPGLSV